MATTALFAAAVGLARQLAAPMVRMESHTGSSWAGKISPQAVRAGAQGDDSILAEGRQAVGCETAGIGAARRKAECIRQEGVTAAGRAGTIARRPEVLQTGSE
jgi:hypothetical protein